MFTSIIIIIISSSSIIITIITIITIGDLSFVASWSDLGLTSSAAARAFVRLSRCRGCLTMSVKIPPEPRSKFQRISTQMKTATETHINKK